MPCALACSLALSSRRPSSCYVDWYLIPDSRRGQLLSDDDVYLRVNESAPALSGGRLVGEENEEYSSEWSSDWRTWEPGEKGGAWNASAPPQGHHARFGPLASFPYRYLMSSMRSLQMRVNLLLASNTVVNDELFCYMALAVGRKAEDSPDAFAFLASTRFSYGRGRVSNLERWLHQRSEPSPEGHGVRSFPDARITQTPSPALERHLDDRRPKRGVPRLHCSDVSGRSLRLQPRPALLPTRWRDHRRGRGQGHYLRRRPGDRPSYSSPSTGCGRCG